MVTHVVFVNSFSYNQTWKKVAEKMWDTKDYPSMEELDDYIGQIEPAWKEVEDRVLTEISDISGLRYKEEKIPCYVTGVSMNFSSPLTISMKRDVNTFIDVLTHEMIHQLFIQNPEVSTMMRQYLMDNYSNESVLTRNHILLHAIHKEVYLRVFGEDRLKLDIGRSQKAPDYKKSWEIVEARGHINLIDEFKKLIK